MAKWKEVDIYTGLVVDEDAPTNATGTAVAGTGDDSSVVVVKKKKKALRKKIYLKDIIKLVILTKLMVLNIFQN